MSSTNKWQIVVWAIGLATLVFLSGSVYGEESEEDPKTKVKTVSGKPKNLRLSLGISKTLKFPFDVGSIAVGDPNLLTYQRLKEGGKTRKVRLVPKGPGLMNMTFYDTKGEPKITYIVRVDREDIGSIITQLNTLIGDIEGIDIKTVGGTVIIDGEILLPRDMVRILRVVDALKDRDPKKKTTPIKNIATISKVTMNIIAERIMAEIDNPEITARVLNENIVLEGTARNDFEADRAVEIAKNYLPEVFVQPSKGVGGEVKPKASGGSLGGAPTIIDLLRIQPGQAPPPAKDIKVTMNYVELSNDYAKSFKFEWKPLATDNSSINLSSAGGLTASLVATISSLFPKLNTLKNHGHARVLKQETLIVKDRADSPAAIESAVDFYTRTTDANGAASLQPVTVQNVTKVKAATIPGSDSLELGVQITLNTLLGIDQGNPIIAKNSLQTQVTIKNGDSAALGGYAIDRALTGYNREPTQSVPGLGDSGAGSTALFNLERSKSVERTKRQYIIFITPEVIRTASAGTEDITRKFRLNAGEL